eukprot:6050576-Amphidinium_carterae.1
MSAYSRNHSGLTLNMMSIAFSDAVTASLAKPSSILLSQRGLVQCDSSFGALSYQHICMTFFSARNLASERK